MTLEVRLSPLAAEDLTAIHEYILIDSPEAAERVRHAFHRAIVKLSQSPGLGHYRSDILPSTVRVYGVYSYLIIYRVQDRILEVVRILHASRDVAAFNVE